ncbi:hypothetical protein PACTADRAFT_40242 [Pachysolen tannophilus NRRL Y-2460]|uniref:Mannosyltransferase n=1 Tax=Pachysolen tannophilus NRRL Y-2460 TaxID=669874 RepID=A0A1E4TZX8_PACTA|nr:hypothetical protein PACTADRAFT_40242 [Pachysolen tannophilus NRRL Y-2460]
MSIIKKLLNLKPAETTIFFVILAIRIFNALTIRTFFQPDEYYQALEPAYAVVFHTDGFTWEWRQKLRSFNYPLLFALGYKVLEMLGLSDNDLLIIDVPKVLQSFISSLGELYLYKFIFKISNSVELSNITLFLSLVSSFNWFFITRTFSNNVEMVLTIVGIYYWPIESLSSSIEIKRLNNISNYISAIIFATMACLVRPTNVIVWGFLGINLCTRLDGLVYKLKVLLVTLLTASIVIMINVVIDYWFYSTLTFPILNFIEFNFIKSLSQFYGVNSLDFYLTQAIPVLSNTYLPCFIWGIYSVIINKKNGSLDKKDKKLYDILFNILILCIFDIFVFSLIKHKEFRFIYPLNPFFLIFVSLGFLRMIKMLKSAIFRYLFIYIIIAVNFSLGFYLTRYHESGVIGITSVLKQQLQQMKLTNEPCSIGFLMPCHSTPYYSYLNVGNTSDIDIWSLTCEPPLDIEKSSDLATYKDESDWFYHNPMLFLKRNFPNEVVYDNDNDNDNDKMAIYKHDWPNFLVIFEDLEKEIIDYLQKNGYEEINRLFNTRAHWDSRRRGDVILYAKRELK